MEKLIYVGNIPDHRCNQPPQMTEVTVEQSETSEDCFTIIGYEKANNGVPQNFAKRLFYRPKFTVLTFNLALDALRRPAERLDVHGRIFTTKAKF